MARDVDVVLGSRRFDPLEEQNSARRDEDNDPKFDPDKVRSWIVQLHRPLDAEESGRLRAEFGLRLTEFVPRLSFVERLTTKVVARLRRDPVVRAVAPVSSGMKLFEATKVNDADDDAPDGEFNAVVFADVDAEVVAQELTALGAGILAVLDPRSAGGPVTIRFTLPFARLEDASLLDGIRWIEPVAERVDDGGVGAPALHAGTAGPIARMWEAGLHGEGQVIGVIDNGPPNRDHCFFRDAGDNTPGPAHRKVVALRNGTGQEPGRHATFVAGLAAGDDLHRPGAAPNRGGAFAAKLVLGNRKDLDVFQPDPPTPGSTAAARTMLEELTAAAQNGARIHTNSWHDKPRNSLGRPAVYDLLARDVDEFAWVEEDHLVVGSSGNSSDQQGSPGTAKNALCVSAGQFDAAGPSLGDGHPGPTGDGRRKPDVMAVGCGVRSAAFDTDCGTGPGNPCASSYATPLAAAMAALVRQYFMEGWYPSGTRQAEQAFVPSGALLKAVLVNAATPPRAPAELPSDSAGWGLVEIDRNLRFAPVDRPMLIRDVRHAQGLTTGQTSGQRVRVEPATEELKATLVWSDAPGTVGAGNLLVNALMLRVVSPDGEVLLGNAFRDSVSAVGGTADGRNNVQAVLVRQPLAGEWRVEVEAVAVHRGRPGQGFALVVSGAAATMPP
jgi:Subtilase family